MDEREEITGVIFDCDGTLADTMPLHYKAWRQALMVEFVDFPEDLFYSLGGMPTPDIVVMLNQRDGREMDPETVAARKDAIYLDLLPQARPIQPVVDLVYAYAGRYPMAVASGGIRPIVVRTIEALGLEHLFSCVATSEDVTVGKPAPDLFLFAAKMMGVRPTGCLVYEDSPLGLEAAKQAKMRGIDVRTLLEPSMVR